MVSCIADAGERIAERIYGGCAGEDMTDAPRQAAMHAWTDDS